MATIKQDPRLKEKEEGQAIQSDTVSGTSGAPTQNIQQDAQAPSQGMQPSTPSPTSQQAQQAPQAAPRASQNAGSGRSGMATNVQSYIDKNKPAAQGISGAVTKNVGKQTGQIKQQAQQRENQLQSQLAENQRRMQEAKSFATQQVSNIMGSSPQQTPAGGQQAQAAPAIQEPQEDAISKFQQYMAGDVGQSQVQNINLSPQQQRLKALQNLSGGVGTESGRQALLKQTFGSGNRDYTRGQSSLDQLILGGDQAASESLTSGVEGQFSSVQDALKNMRQGAAADIDAQKRALGGIGQEISGIASGAEEGLTGEVQSAYEKALAERQGIFGEQDSAYARALADTESKLGSAQSMLEGQNYIDMLRSAIPDAYATARDKYGVGYGDAKTTNLEAYVDNLQQFQDTGKVTKYVRKRENGPGYGSFSYMAPVTLEGKEAQEFLAQAGGTRASHHKNRSALLGLMDVVNQRLGLGEDLYGVEGLGGGFYAGEKGSQYAQDIGGLQDYYKKQLESVGSAEDILKRKLKEEAGLDYDRLVAGEDIGQYELASPEQLQRINALKKLTGQSDFIDQDTSGYQSVDDLKSILEKYATSKGPRS